MLRQILCSTTCSNNFQWSIKYFRWSINQYLSYCCYYECRSIGFVLSQVTTSILFSSASYAELPLQNKYSTFDLSKHLWTSTMLLPRAVAGRTLIIRALLCISICVQVATYKATWQLMCGRQLYPQFQQAEFLASKSLVTDPIVIRLFFVILFFSTPLHYHQDSATPTKVLKKKRPITDTQHAYITLLWKYLSYRYGSMETVRIYTHLVHVYIKMQTVGFGIYTRLSTQKNLIPTNETLNKLVAIDVHEVQMS